MITFSKFFILVIFLFTQITSNSQNTEWNLSSPDGIELSLRLVDQYYYPSIYFNTTTAIVIDIYEKNLGLLGYGGFNGKINLNEFGLLNAESSLTGFCIDSTFSSVNFNFQEDKILLKLRKKKEPSNYECFFPFARIIIVVIEGAIDGGNDDDTFSLSIDDVFLEEEIFIDLNLSSQFCFASGTATANVIGGFPPYTYLWSNNYTLQEINNLTAGEYSVTVSDSLGNNSSVVFEIENSVVQEFDNNGDPIECELANETVCPYDINFGENLKEGTYSALNEIYTNSILKENDSVILSAGNSVLLDAGFFVKQNSSLDIYIENCN